MGGAALLLLLHPLGAGVGAQPSIPTILLTGLTQRNVENSANAQRNVAPTGVAQRNVGLTGDRGANAI